MFCPNCGNEIKPGEKICGACGTKAPEITKKEAAASADIHDEAQNTFEAEGSGPKKRKKLLFILIPVAAAVIIAVVLASVFSGKNRSEDTAKSDERELESLLNDVAQDQTEETETETTTAQTVTTTAQGVYNDLKWTLDSAGTLTISPVQGSCEMPDFFTTASNKPPWYSYRDSVTSVIIESGITGIGDYAFIGCHNMETITMPSTVQYITSNAFGDCKSLVSINIPSGVTEIDVSAFDGCYSLQAINVTEGNGSYASADGVLFTADMQTLILYPLAKADVSYTVPDGVQYISPGAFSRTSLGASSETDTLESVVLPESLIEIGGDAFYECEKLKRVVIAGAETIGTQAFYNCDSLETVEITGAVEYVGESAFYGCDSLTGIEFPEGLIRIYDSAFAECSSLTSVTLPSSLERIREGAFSNSALTDVYYSGSQSQWNNVRLDGSDTRLAFANMHYDN